MYSYTRYTTYAVQLLAGDVDGNGDSLMFEMVHDLRDVGLDMRWRIIIKKEKKVQQEAADLGRKLLVLDMI
jgi:hypothetical protein